MRGITTTPLRILLTREGNRKTWNDWLEIPPRWKIHHEWWQCVMAMNIPDCNEWWKCKWDTPSPTIINPPWMKMYFAHGKWGDFPASHVRGSQGCNLSNNHGNEQESETFSSTSPIKQMKLSWGGEWCPGRFLHPWIINDLIIPIGSMYGTFPYIWLMFMVNVGKYTIHGFYGLWFMKIHPSVQWWLLIPVKGDRWQRAPQKAIKKSGIHCLLGGYMLPTTFYGNQK